MQNPKKPQNQKRGKNRNSDSSLMTFSGHLEVFRQMLLRTIVVVFVSSFLVFYFKDATFEIILAPCDSDFITYKSLESILSKIGISFLFEKFEVSLITTELSSQFMTHFSTSLYLGLLISSPYILFEIIRFITPALYENEKKISWTLMLSMYFMFLLGMTINYFVIFPFSVRFLGTYSVAAKVHSTITLDSYMDTFTSLSLVMGLIFLLPIISYILAINDIVCYDKISGYRKHAIIVIAIIAAVITPPDVMTLLLVVIPLYMLFELSLWIVKKFHRISMPSELNSQL